MTRKDGNEKDYRYVVDVRGDTLNAELWYPAREHGEPGKLRYVQVGMCDVRAADDIRIHYDFQRDGWSIQQASRFSFRDENDVDEDWQEVAFVQAWARRVPDEWDS